MSTFDEEETVSVQGNGVYLNPKDLVNHLLLVWAVGYVDNAPTKFSKPGQNSDVIIVDCVDLDQMDPNDGQRGKLGLSCWWRGARLIRDLKAKVGNPAPRLVYMTLGTATQGNPPYELVLASTDPRCRAIGEDWLNRHPDFKPGTVTQSAAATAAFTPSTNGAQPTPHAQAPGSISVPNTPTAPEPLSTVDILKRLADQSEANAARFQGKPPF